MELKSLKAYIEFSRDSNGCLSSLKKEKDTLKSQLSAPPSTPSTPQSHLTPKQLSFASPQDKTNSPSSSVISDVSSLSSTSVTPDFAKLGTG